MSKLTSSSNLTRQQRLDRSWRLTAVSGVSGAACLGTGVLAVVGVVGAGVPLAAAAVAGGAGYAARRTLKK